MKMRKVLSLLGVVFLLCGVAQAQEYTFKTYAAPAGGELLTILGINNIGRMVGAYWAGQGIRRAVKIDLMGRFFEITIPNATGVVPIGLDKYGDITGYCVPTAITKLRSFILSYPMSCSNKVQQTHRKNRKTAPIQWPLLKPMTVKP